MKSESEMIAAVTQWVEDVVIGLNLCPFARKPQRAGLVRYQVSGARDEEALLADMAYECGLLAELPASELETTLIIVPGCLAAFEDYNQFLDLAEALIAHLGYTGEFQLASFHPDYQFAGTEPGDAENLTNRAPYPVLHLIREASIEKVLAHYPDPEAIPEHNIRRVSALSADERARLFPYLFGGHLSGG
ncbi:DUF1415 domain-containing protein [Simiduia agarivorans]|uniref:Uncharacterized protein n=1 Tax=Simiduia agarivorans (strain DSM 21679 / JCM 13881 / BCRC 17597 / SA1) TaxID=1117647 RepID=K4KLN7_SIMAS|nr:DUF1415 domain-containing protein [Simiduia agarivorans]AFU99946.1 hypothetical protein M5M_14040 [Simiduia agarivorans SA1 = DSM 21679]